MLAIQDIGKVKISSLTGHEELNPQTILHPIEFQTWQHLSPDRARDFLRGRYTLKRLLTSDDKLHTRLIASMPSGKPVITDSPEVFCSISHTEDYAVAATSIQTAIGVDVEKITPRHPALLRDISTEEERQHLAMRFSAEEMPTTAWTIKEAAAKADGAIFPFREYQIFLGEKIMVVRSLNRWEVTLTEMPSHICAVAIAI